MEGEHRGAAPGTTAKALGSCLLAPCPLLGQGEHWCQSLLAGHSGGSTSAAAAQRGTKAAEQGYLTWWLQLRAEERREGEISETNFQNIVQGSLGTVFVLWAS